ncbi:unnamed protein product [Peniophora sp. CBMAI 1063]|nr:unnamed protein product [Peniophora sp. CBMAI 1063]
MCSDLECSYLLSCNACQRNKSPTTKPVGPLHPHSVPDTCGNSVTIDFNGPLSPFGPENYDFLMTMTNRASCNIHAVPYHKTLTTKGAVHLFFQDWYCENGLPLKIISDHDTRFDNQLWCTFHKLTGITLVMSSSFHTQTNGASEQMNKTLIPAVRHHVDHLQDGWADALPAVRFAI